MKKLLTILFLSIFLISMASAFEFDNIKSYDSQTQQVTIKNSFLDLIPLSDIASVKLNTPTIFQVTALPDDTPQLVFEYTINSASDYTNFIQGMRLIDKNTNKPITREITYKQKVITEVPNYINTDCKLDKGVTVGCVQKETGTYHEEVSWIPISNKDIKVGQEITIGGFVDVQTGDNVEWIPSFAGVEVNEWAVWTDSLNVNLNLYYNMTDADEKVNHLQNMTTKTGTGGSFNYAGYAGKVGSEYHTTTGNNANIISNLTSFKTNFTMIGWYFTTGDVTTPFTLFSQHQGSVSFPRREIYISSGNLLSSSIGSETMSYAVRTNEWYHIALVINDSSILWYVNGTYVQTVANNISWGVGHEGTADYFAFGTGLNGDNPDGVYDELLFASRPWSATEVSDNYNAGNGMTYIPTPFVPTVGASVQSLLYSPANSYNTTATSITFNASGIPLGTDTNLTNATLYIWDGIGSPTTKTTNILLGNVSNNTIWNVNSIADGNYTWNVLIGGRNSTADVYAFNNTNRSFMVDTTPPTINLTYPKGTLNYFIKNTNLTINWSTLDSLSSLNTCWFVYNNVNTTVSCSAGNAPINISDSSINTASFWANDSVGNTNFNQTNWSYKVFETAHYIPTAAFSGSSNNYQLNFTDTVQQPLSVAYLVYNRTRYSTSFTQSGSDYSVNKTLGTPTPAVTSENRPIYFILDFNDGSEVNTTTITQNASMVSIDDCTANTQLIYNFTVFDEDTLTKLDGAVNNVTVEVGLDLYSTSDASTIIASFNKNYTATNPAQVCIQSGVLGTVSYLGNLVVRYDADPYISEFYYQQQQSIGSSVIPFQIPLYDLLTTRSQEFKFIFKDATLAPLKNHLAILQRKYISDGTTKTVEIGKTDVDGTTLLHLVLSSVTYQMTLSLDGQIVTTIPAFNAYCDDVSTGNCQRTFYLYENPVANRNINTIGNINFNTLSYNSTNGLVSTSFSTTDGLTANMLLNVTDQHNVQICSQSLISTSGTLSCTVPNTITNQTIDARLYSSSRLLAGAKINLNPSPVSIYGSSRGIMAFGLVITITMMAFSNGVFMLILFALGLYLASDLLLISLSIPNDVSGGILPAALIGFIVIIIIFVYKISHRGEQ